MTTGTNINEFVMAMYRNKFTFTLDPSGCMFPVDEVDSLTRLPSDHIAARKWILVYVFQSEQTLDSSSLQCKTAKNICIENFLKRTK